MSLVGSLEALNLGDILQIVSLSRKSGVLSLRSQVGEGRIILRDGRVCAASVKGDPEDLRGLLVGGRFVTDEQFDEAVNLNRRTDLSLDDALYEKTALDRDRIDVLRREQVERAVIQMFDWRHGEFSFEVAGEIDDRDSELLLANGVNAEYLAMEATRLADEQDQPAKATDAQGDRAIDPDDPDLMFSDGENEAFGDRFPGVPEASPPSGDAEPTDAVVDDAHESFGLTVAQRFDVEIEAATRPAELEPSAPAETASETPAPLDAQVDRDEVPTISPVDVASLVNDPPTPPWSRPSPLASDLAPARLIAIDPDLNALEWLKSVLVGSFSRIHIFQRSEAGVARIQQYLGRGELPLVLVSSRVGPDRVGGTADVGELTERLRLLAPKMPILVTTEHESANTPLPRAADAVVERPSSRLLAESGGGSALEAAGRQLRAILEPWRVRSRDESAKLHAPSPNLGLERLVEASARLRDPESCGEVLPLVLRFASDYFARVAIFTVQDEVVVGLAQQGLETTGGPSDPALRELMIRAVDVEWFRDAIASRRALRARPTPGSSALTDLLGRNPPSEVFVAPIESGGIVTALLYGDALPGSRPIGDTSPVEILLHQAGLALDRARLSRAIEES